MDGAFVIRKLLWWLLGFMFLWLAFIRPRERAAQQLRVTAVPLRRAEPAPAAETASAAGADAGLSGYSSQAEVSPEHGASGGVAPDAAGQAPGETAKPAGPGANKDKADDLRLIEGVGPKTAAALLDAGINTFEQLAKLTPEIIEEIVREAGVRMVGHATTWPEQARLAASGDMEALQRYQEQLRAGQA